MTDINLPNDRAQIVRYSSIGEVTPPPVEPVPLALARSQCRVIAFGSPPTHPEDALIGDIYIPAAREWVESYLRRTLVQRTRRICYPSWSAPIELLMPPVQSVVSVQYVDDTGALQTLAPDQYRLDAKPLVPRIAPALDVTWPDLADVSDAVQVTYVAGYAAVGSPPDYTKAIPALFKWAALVIIGDLYENREKSNVMELYQNRTLTDLLYPQRVFTL